MTEADRPSDKADGVGRSWCARVLTLFPEMFPGPLGLSLAGKALEQGRWRLEALDIRSFATDKHRTVDDTPFGGGPGMVMRPDVVDAALEAATIDKLAPAIYLTPRGRRVDQALVRDWAAGRIVADLPAEFFTVPVRAPDEDASDVDVDAEDEDEPKVGR